jgi:hypothetical protein
LFSYIVDVFSASFLKVNDPPPERGGSCNGLKALFRPKAGRMDPAPSVFDVVEKSAGKKIHRIFVSLFYKVLCVQRLAG